MNEWCIRDLSRKQRTAIRVKGESGNHFWYRIRSEIVKSRTHCVRPVD